MRPIGTCVWSTRANPFLSAENLVDFQRFMGELDRAGREDHFWKMWGAVWEVCHLPIPDEVLTHLSCGGRQVPLRRFVCVAKVWAASNSPYWDLGVGSVFARTLGSVAMRLEGCSQLAGPSCRRSSVCSELLASKSQTLSPQPSGGLFSQLSLIVSTIEQVRGSTKCSPPAAAGNKAKPFGRTPLLMCPRPKQAAWVLHVAASPPEVPMPHACVFCGTLVGSETPQVHAGTAGCVLIERLVSQSSSDS